ncbi:hypothetical protein D3C72_1728030 [compost metagenome]
MVKKLPRLLDIFSLSTRTKPLCTQNLARGLPLAPSLWAISFSWCGNCRSMPPPWMSKVSPSVAPHMAEHSMCQPGRPEPNSLSHLASGGSSGLEDFHSTKSSGSSLPSSTATRSPARSSSSDLPESLP